MPSRMAGRRARPVVRVCWAPTTHRKHTEHFPTAGRLLHDAFANAHLVLDVEDHQQCGALVVLHPAVERLEAESVLERAVHQFPRVANGPWRKPRTQLSRKNNQRFMWRHFRWSAAVIVHVPAWREVPSWYPRRRPSRKMHRPSGWTKIPCDRVTQGEFYA